MKRDFDTLYARNEQSGFQVGDDAAHRAAAALADKADAPTIQALTYLLDMAELIGGQFHVTAVREKFDRHGNRIADAGDGKFETIGLVFNYETRDLRIEPATAPDTVFGLPVTDSHAPANQVEGGPAQLSEEELEAALVEAGLIEDPGAEEEGSPGLEEFEKSAEVEEQPVAAE